MMEAKEVTVTPSIDIPDPLPSGIVAAPLWVDYT